MAYYSGGVGGGGGKLSAVDAILAEAADLVALEQIAKLNTAHLAADDSALPSTLEARFRKLKSLPSAAAGAAPPPPVRTLARSRSVTAPHHTAALPGPNDPPAPELHPPPAALEDPPPPADAEANGGWSSPRQARAPAAPAPAVQDDAEDDLDRLFGSRPRGRPTLRERNTRRDSSSSSSASPSPTRQACCFGFSPKKKPLQRAAASGKAAKKKVHQGSSGDVLGVDAGEWGDENRRMATELREQQRRLRKALEDQVQVSRETAKMARWVKQASVRMTYAEAIDDLLSDCEDEEEELK